MSTSLASRVTAFALLFGVGMCNQGCFRHVIEERQLPNVAYLSFPGAASGANVHASGPRNYDFTVTGSSDARFAVEAGRYEITVTQGETLLARRIVFVAAGETKEVTR